MGLQLQPDWHFLGLKDGLENAESLAKALINHCATLDMHAMANDVAPFLFQAADVNKVLHFQRLVNQYWNQESA
jgi:hypothetical protein